MEAAASSNYSDLDVVVDVDGAQSGSPMHSTATKAEQGRGAASGSGYKYDGVGGSPPRTATGGAEVVGSR